MYTANEVIVLLGAQIALLSDILVMDKILILFC